MASMYSHFSQVFDECRIYGQQLTFASKFTVIIPNNSSSCRVNIESRMVDKIFYVVVKNDMPL